MLTPRGALHYKVEISLWAAGRCYMLPKINNSYVFCKTIVIDELQRSSTGKLFHSIGAAIAKLRSL